MKRRLHDVTVALTLVLIASPVAADDFGYDQDVQPAKAVALPLNGQKPTAKPGSVPSARRGGARPLPLVKPTAAIKSTAKQQSNLASKAPATAPTSMVPGMGAPKMVPKGLGAAKAGATKLDLAVECWSQIYQLASGKKLNDSDHKRLVELTKRSSQGQSVLLFWPKVTDYLVKRPEQTENYGDLLRALLRWRARTLVSLTDSAALAPQKKEESAFITEILGPQKVAVAGSPDFTEEAVEAYADMACFLYEQSNPGKSINAFDNRAMFASVVCEKFRNAPADKDKAAMAAFDLSWAKFKVAWESANDATRTEMLAALQKTGANAAGKASQDPVLHIVLENWRI